MGASSRGTFAARSSQLRFLSPWATIPPRCRERRPSVEPHDAARVVTMGGRGGGGVSGTASLPPTAALRGGGIGSGRATTRLMSTAVAASVPESAAADDEIVIIKPDRDVRSYRYLTLPNGLEVVVVNDPFTEQAAASMFIRAGHMQDPPELAGLAHFHEHSELPKMPWSKRPVLTSRLCATGSSPVVRNPGPRGRPQLVIYLLPAPLPRRFGPAALEGLLDCLRDGSVTCFPSARRWQSLQQPAVGSPT